MSERDDQAGVGRRASDRADQSDGRHADDRADHSCGHACGHPSGRRTDHRTDHRSVEDYVDDLLCRLRVGSRARRRIGHEVADHLTALVAEEQARGLALPAAARRAAARFGSPSDVAEEFNHDVAVHGLRRSAWALTVCVAADLAAAGGALRGWGPAKPWPNESMFHAVPELLVQVAAVCALNGLGLAVSAPWIRGLPLSARPLQSAARSVTAAAVALVPVAVVSAGNIGGAGWGEGAMSAFVVVAVPVAMFWSLRAARRTGRLSPTSQQDPESTLDVLAACSWALAERWSWTGHAYAHVTNTWSGAVGRAPALMSWFELRRHPWRTACTVSLAAGIALKTPDLLLKGEVDLPAAVVESAAVFIAYTLLSGLLGLRERVIA